MKNVTILATAMLASFASADTVNFDSFNADAPPPGWTATRTGAGQEKWTIAKDDTAPSKPNDLKQSGQATFPICLKDDTNLKDGFVEVKIRPVLGNEDQASGLIWRAKDAKNYYIAQMRSRTT